MTRQYSRREVLRQSAGAAALSLASIVGLGCREKAEAPKPEFYALIDANPNLGDEEKGLAKRIYEHFSSGEKLRTLGREDLYLPPEFFESETYKKWGFGDRRNFTTGERVYLKRIEETEDFWREYNSINMNSLSKEDQEGLEEMHQKYGVNPRVDETINKYPDEEEFFDAIRILTGHETLNDRDLIALKKMAEAIVLGIMIGTTHSH